MKHIAFFSTLFFVLGVHTLWSAEQSNIYFSQISTKDGLSQNSVRAILEDRKGFIWAGTLNGLNRFDGYQLFTYNPQPGNPKSLIDNRIKNVFQDKDGYLWIKTYKNEFTCYDPINDSFVNYLPEGYKNSAMFYTDYYESSNGDIWLWGNTSGCLLIKKQNGVIKSTPFLTDQINKKQCRFLLEDSKSTVWVGGTAGIFKISPDKKVERLFEDKYSFTNAIEMNNKLYLSTENSVLVEYDLKKKAFEEIIAPLPQYSFTNIARISKTELMLVTRFFGIISYNTNTRQFGKISWGIDPELVGNIELITDKNNGLWLYNHSGNIWYFNPATQFSKKLNLIPHSIAKIIDLERYNVFIDSKNLIWITTYGNGLFCYNPVTGKLDNYKYSPTENSLASDYLLSITEDKYGNIWIGSEYAGIIKIVKADYELQVIRPEKETSIGKNNNVRTIYEDSYNNIWVGTKNGSLYLYDYNLSSNTCIQPDLNPYSLTEDSQHRIWVGTKGNGLYIFDQKTHKEIYHTKYNEDAPDKKGLSHNSIFNIFRDNKGRMWVGTFGGGLNLATPTKDGFTFTHFFNNLGNKSYIRYVFQDSKNRIWAGTSDGIIRFDPEELIRNPKAYISYQLDLNKKNSLNCNDIKTFYEDKSGTIWIGTAGGGLNKYIEKTDSFEAYTTKNGLSGDVISGILEDKKNNLWVSSENGITKFDVKNHSFMVYYFSEKTYGNHFNENANIYSENGNMLWGSLDGLLMFNPDSFVPNMNVPPVTLTNFFIYSQKVEAGEKDSPLKRAISYTSQIHLNYKENTFTLEFATLALKDPQKNKYSYMLTNYDKQWSIPSNVNSVTYKNLPPGQYTFMVKGSNSDGIWNEQITTLEITITPPIWKSAYAYIFYILIIGIMLYIAAKLALKFNILNNNIRIEKELTNHKLRFFTNISHEFRTPLTLIRGAVENLNEQQDVPQSVAKQVNVLNRNSIILTRLIDQLLEFRKLQNNVLTLDLEETDIISFSEYIYAGFQEVAAQKSINYTFSHNIKALEMFIDKRKVDKILYNLLSNAFKFTPKDGKIELVINANPETKTCLISVKDNGIGVDKEMQHLLFSRFMQINFSSSGTGVGLSLVKEFVEGHKGKIWYESNEGGGSVFNVELSTDKDIYEGDRFISSSHADIIEEKASSNVVYPSESTDLQLPEIDDAVLGNYKMLIIDDNDDIRNFLVDEFSKHFMVDTAENGLQGLEKARENNPDLIICDVMMPEMDGFEVTRCLKEDFQTCHIPIILLTAHSSIEHQLEGIQSGADAYIMKPFSLKYLVARVFKLIEQRELLKKRFSNEYVFDGNLITTTDKDKDFYNLINKILDDHIADYQFSVDKFAELAKLRRTIFYKKVKGITGLSPNELIKIKRLKKAAELLLTGQFTVSEVSFKVGFEDPFYFSKCFKTQYKCSPSKYGQQPESKEE